MRRAGICVWRGMRFSNDRVWLHYAPRFGTRFGLHREIASESESLRFSIQVFREPRPTKLEPEKMALLGRCTRSSRLSFEDIEDTAVLLLLLLLLLLPLLASLSDCSFAVGFRTNVRFCFCSR